MADAENPAGPSRPVEAQPPHGVGLISAERTRQQSVEGWSAAHDDVHDDGELAEAAACYAIFPATNMPWPWEPKWDKRGKHGRIRRLVIAGALIAAEIDRLIRAGASVPAPPADTPATECISCHGYLAEGWHCARCGRDGPLKSPKPPDSPVIPDSSTQTGNAKPAEELLARLQSQIEEHKTKAHRIVRLSEHSKVRSNQFIIFDLEDGGRVSIPPDQVARMWNEEEARRVAPAVADTREREPMTIASLDAETRKIIYLAHIVTKFQATPERMNKLRDAVSAWDAKHESERTRNLINGIFGVDADTPSDKEKA